MIARLLPLVVVACSSSKQPPPPIDHGVDAGSEASTGPVASGCTDGLGGDGSNGNGTTCFESFTCQDGAYRVDCACPQATCTCSAPNGTVYRSISFDCDAGCGYPLSTAGAGCGLNP